MQQLLPGEQRPQPNDFGFNGSVDDLLRGMFDDNFRQSGGATPPPQPPRPPQTPRAAKSPNPEQSSQDQALAEIRIIVARVTANDRQFAWLANEDPANVLRVVNTVKKLRATAAAKQETITDKAIYIRYRRSIENNNPDKTLEVSFRILDALMGGKVNGSLPF